MSSVSVILTASCALNLIAALLYYATRDYSLVKLEELAGGDRARKRIEPIIEDQDGHVLALGAVRVASSVAVTASMLVVAGVFQPEGSGVSPVRLIFGVLGAWVYLYVMGLMIPLSVARHAAERVVLGTSDLIRAIYILAWPIRALWVVDEAIRRLVGAEAQTEKDEIKEELLSAAAEGEREGAIAEEERDMIEAVVEFGSTTAAEIMTPRTDIEAIELTDDLGTIIKTVRDIGHSRIPVYEGTVDHIVGIFYIKDLMRWLAGDGVKGAGRAFRLKSVLRPALFVPETKPVRELLDELIKQKVHIAVVTDEYGGTSGVVTVEDIVEEIFGEIQDEYELPEDAPPSVTVDASARSAEVDARASIYDVNEALEPLGVEVPEGKDYDTIGGYVMATLGHIPVRGEVAEGEGFLVTVLEAEPTRVVRLKIEPKESAPEGQPAGSREEAPAEKP